MADTEQKNENADTNTNTKTDTNTDENPPPPAGKQATTLRPLLYKFKVAPVRGNVKQSALQMSFSVLFDNLIAVLWSMYNKETQIRCGVNQIQWALEFMRCLKVDYNYPEGIGKIVKTLEKNMIELYSKISEVQNKEKEIEPSVELKDSKTDTKKLEEYALYYNEKEILKKLETIEIRMDRVTGEPRYIKELNQLGKRKPKAEDCKNDKSSPQTFVIGALKKILKKATEVDTITEVEELIKELNVQNNTPVGTKPSNKGVVK